MTIFKSLSKELQSTIKLLLLGMLLKQFDIICYINIIILLNELLLLTTNSYTLYSLLSITFIFRLIGTLVFEWANHYIGHKTIVILTMVIKIVSYFVIVILLIYTNNSITVCITTLCILFLSITSLIEETGVELYLIQAIKLPKQYCIIILMETCGIIAIILTLGIIWFITYFNIDLYYIFVCSIIITMIGATSRIILRNISELMNAKCRIVGTFRDMDENPLLLKQHPIWKKKVCCKTVLSYLLIQCLCPISFYYIYIYCTNILKNSFGFTLNQIVLYNLTISIIHLFFSYIIAYLSYNIDSLKIFKTMSIVFSIVILFSPFLLSHISTPYNLCLMQVLYIAFTPRQSLVVPIFFKHFTVLKRFAYIRLSFILSHVIVYSTVALNSIYPQLFNDSKLLITSVVICGYWLGFYHLDKLEERYQLCN